MMTESASRRRMMIDTQLRTYDVTGPRVLEAFDAVPREVFLPGTPADLAYRDQSVTVSAGGTTRVLAQPMVLARMIQALDIAPGQSLLDVAGGSGYSAAVLSGMGEGCRVLALEESEGLVALARGCLDRAGHGAVRTIRGDLSRGDPDGGPHDAILVNGALESEPQGLLDQLVDGGRLVAVMGHGRAGRVTLFTRSGKAFGRKAVFDAAMPALAAFAREEAFVF
jgi:protein-L-isoaspartate(D-aspartate) O-methyltransferase